MKKHLYIYILPLLMFLGACQKNEVESVFDQSPEDRTNSEISRIKSDLVGNEYGWLSEYYYNDSTMHTTMVFHFNNDNRVEIESVFEDYLNKESNYKMRYSQQFDLTFDTYCVLGYLMDQTKYADFRWELESEADGEYKFISRASKTEGISYLTLKRADETTATYLKEQQVIHKVRTKLANDPEKSYFRNLRVNGLPYGFKFSFNIYNDEASFFGPMNGGLGTFTTIVAINGNGTVTLNEPLDLGGVFIREFVLNEADDMFVITKDEVISGAGAILYDNAPPFTMNGIASFVAGQIGFLSRNFSPKLQRVVEGIRKDLPSFVSFQLYNAWGQVLVQTNPAQDGTNMWDGQRDIAITVVAQDLISYDNTDATTRIPADRSWFKPAYETNEYLQFLYDTFLCDPEGLYIVQEANGYFTFVSKSDPTLHITFKL